MAFIGSYVCRNCGAAVQSENDPGRGNCPAHSHRFWGGAHNWELVGSITVPGSSRRDLDISAMDAEIEALERQHANAIQDVLAAAERVNARIDEVQRLAQLPDALLAGTPSPAPIQPAAGEVASIPDEAFSDGGEPVVVQEVMVQVGDAVVKDQVLALVETPRWMIEVTAPVSGTVQFILSVHSTVAPGAAVAVVA